MRNLILNQPGRLVIQEGAVSQLAQDVIAKAPKAVFALIDPNVVQSVSEATETLKSAGIAVTIVQSSGAEPSFSDFEKLVAEAKAQAADFVIGIGGGSVLDLAKLVAALLPLDQSIGDFVGNGLIKERTIPLYCAPTTSGAGSEASPNAILIDENDNSKKGIIDAAMMPDAVYIDPVLIAGLPPKVTAFTGLDALTHCIEAYANINAHPVVDMYALEGIRLISQNLGNAIANGQDLEARKKVALGAYYGGMCLGPVNTAAVHALAYPLGTKYHIAHGLSNALLLPFVLEFNLSAAVDRYAAIALAMGGETLETPQATAEQGIALIRQFIADCGMPSKLSELDIELDAVEEMAEDALKIQRLLKNNLKEVKLQDAVEIYKNAY